MGIKYLVVTHVVALNSVLPGLISMKGEMSRAGVEAGGVAPFVVR
jgi:hypothetical protein